MIYQRPKLDPNREIHIGASRCYEVLEAFKQYHQCIHDTKKTFKHGLLIDLHGRGMDDGITQIGEKHKGGGNGGPGGASGPLNFCQGYS